MNAAIDLRSDTFTKPSEGMLKAMFNAEVGDDVWDEDPTVKKLEEKAAEMFGMEAALFCPSGTQTNQIAIRVHTNPGDEVICDTTSHIYRFEGGGVAYNSHASVRLINGNFGIINAQDILDNINENNIHQARTTLVSLENTTNMGGGNCYHIEDIHEINKVCKDNKLKLHLDGARLFNAFRYTGEMPKQYGEVFDSISICLSKGLGAPIGSLLLSTKDFISESKRARKVFGGAMRQSGFLAAAGIYALDYQVERLDEDHLKAKEIASVLAECKYVEKIYNQQTNILIFKFTDQKAEEYVHLKFKEHNIKVSGFGPLHVRMVTHLDYTDEMHAYTLQVLKGL